MSDFINEIHGGRGFTIHSKLVTVTIQCIIADAPAKNYLKRTKGHTGYNSSSFCAISGEMLNNTMTFSDPSRIDQSFRDKQDEDHHFGQSPFLRLEIDLVKDFSFDSLLVVYLGVMRRMIFSSCRKVQQVGCHAVKLWKCLGHFSRCIPSDFNRRGRPLNEWRNWKATEYRLLFCYTGIYVFKEVLDANV